MEDRKRVGLIVNPIAGIGGKAGFKGSDGEEIQEAALKKGFLPEAPDKAMAALELLKPMADRIEIWTYEGLMGQEEAQACGFCVKTMGRQQDASRSSGEDTEQLAQALMGAGVDLILFAGGDGTARNICKAVEQKVPVIGIPAGVKIHSGVYAIDPRSAGHAAVQFLSGETPRRKEAEVMDLDEDLYRKGIVSPRLYGYMSVPDNSRRIQHVKMRSTAQSISLDYIATDVIQSMEDDILYVIGAGSTTRNIMILLGLDYTLIGVDAVYNKKLVGKDLDEQQLWQLVQEHESRLVVTAIGGQGHIFGRGNQQISPRVIRKVGKENISVIATKEKLLSLPGRRMLTDTGDADLDLELTGFIRVITGLDERTMCAVGCLQE